ncbi:MAG: hypothetical protein WDO13_15625 [Verrucomicrobiota bacterium]
MILSSLALALMAAPVAAWASAYPDFDEDAKPILRSQPGLLNYVKSRFEIKDTGMAKYPGDDDHRPPAALHLPRAAGWLQRPVQPAPPRPARPARPRPRRRRRQSHPRPTAARAARLRRKSPSNSPRRAIRNSPREGYAQQPPAADPQQGQPGYPPQQGGTSSELRLRDGATSAPVRA